jgi:hypothetical protein
MRLRDTQGVTSILATHRLQDAFGLANFRFDKQANRVIRAQQNGFRRPDEIAETTLVVLRDGKAYFEGSPAQIAASPDNYLRRFLVSA